VLPGRIGAVDVDAFDPIGVRLQCERDRAQRDRD